MDFFLGACDLSLNHISLPAAPADKMLFQQLACQTGIMGFADNLITVSSLIIAHEDPAVSAMIFLHGVNGPAHGGDI